ncbi:hypothetical protein LJC09_01975 [Desulfovibrio sp. OttesenSCG-928-F20]|nr:hypothetical protein [Desulfovibrio sp. OttesenSCG-928-M16]MDL2290858.1 hypothetical protein [Desulfovibrio sp. OttesenSCG-928-F20]
MQAQNYFEMDQLRVNGVLPERSTPYQQRRNALRTQNIMEMDYPCVKDVLKEDPSLYHLVISGLLGVLASLAGFIVLAL